MPTMSIIIPVFNRHEIFARSLASARAQTYVSTEIIVVDDGSTPALKSEIKIQNQESKITYFRQANKGAPAARNFGFSQSHGEYVIFWDADVIAPPDLLGKLYEGLQKNSAASYSYCDFYFGRKKMLTGPFDAARLRRQNYITTTSLIRCVDFPGFDESLKKFQDWDVWLTMLAQHKIGVYTPQTNFEVVGGGVYSQWLPRAAYRAPWKWLPGVRSRVQSYETARRIIANKHHLNTDGLTNTAGLTADG